MRGDPADPSLPRERPERDPNYKPVRPMTDDEMEAVREWSASNLSDDADPDFVAESW